LLLRLGRITAADDPVADKPGAERDVFARDGLGTAAASLGGATNSWRNAPTIYLEPFEHNLAARLSGFEERVRTLEVCGTDGAEVLRNRGADFPRVDESRDPL
jgi:hypothetical protein